MTAPVILHVYAVEYSARTLLVPQLRHLAGIGFDVRLACAFDGELAGDELRPFRPQNVPFTRRLEPRRALLAGRRLVEVVEEVRPALVHLHSSSAAAAARLVPRLPGDPIVAFTVHGFPFQWNRLTKPRDLLLERLEWALSRRTDLLLFQSREDLDGAVRHKFRGRLRYLGNGVQDSWFDLEPPPPHDERLRLLFIGRLIRAKGILDLLTVVGPVGSVEVVVAGSRLSTERDDITADIDRLAADPRLAGRLTFLAAVHPDKMQEVMGEADVVVLPTFHDEGVPRSLIEAMASARPVVATRVRGCRELVDDGVEGLLVPPRDPAALRSALEAMVEVGPARRKELGEAARRRAWSRHREADVCRRLVDAYAEVGVTVPSAVSTDAR